MEAAREDRPRVAHGPPKTGQPGQRGTQSYSLPPANQASRQNGVLTVGEVTGCRRSSRHWRRERCPLRPPRHVRPQHPVIKWPSSRIGWPCQAKRVGGAHDAAALKSGPEFSSYPEKGPPAAVGVPGGLPEACRAPRCGVTGIDRGRGEELVPNAALLHNVRVSGGAGDGEKTEGGTPRWSAARPTGLAASERERRVPRWSVAGLVRPRRRNEKARIKHSFAKAWRKPRDDGSGARRARARGTPGEVGAGHGGTSDRD
jgi:hypothetical protein